MCHVITLPFPVYKQYPEPKDALISTLYKLLESLAYKL